MSVYQRMLKTEMSFRHMKGKEETSVELLEEILSNQNMNEAYKRVYRNKGASGIDGVSVEELKVHLREHKDELRAQIRKRKYQPAPALRVEIQKENGKKRKLGILTVDDRMVKLAKNQKFIILFDKKLCNH